MSNKQALRDLQDRLAERLQQVQTEQRGKSWLAVDSAGLGVLLPLQEAGEIFEMGAVLPIPHTQHWLVGVVNLRGGVYTVVDLAQFLGLRGPTEPTPRDRAQLVALNPSQGVNGALLVDKLQGLRHAADMQPEPESVDNAPRPAFAVGRWRDRAGRSWQEISLARLAQSGEFLAIAA